MLISAPIIVIWSESGTLATLGRYAQHVYQVDRVISLSEMILLPSGVIIEPALPHDLEYGRYNKGHRPNQNF